MSSPFSGGVKFFEPSMCLEVNGASIDVTSGAAGADYAIDRNPLTFWRSVGSNDTVTETLEITLDDEHEIDRIFLLDHNFKQYTVEYDLVGVWTAFTGVVGINGSLSGITETTFAEDTAYYEFDAVTTSKIRIQVLKTQVVDAEKYLCQGIATTAIGTLVGYPTVEPISLDRNARQNRTLSGKVIVQKSSQSVGISLSFRNYPNQSHLQDDLALIMTLFDREDPFMVWLCGGKFDFASLVIRGFRLVDLFTVQLTKSYGIGYQNGIYVLGFSNRVEMQEHV